MMLKHEDIEALRQQVRDTLKEADHYFADAKPVKVDRGPPWAPDEYWSVGDAKMQEVAESVRMSVKELSVAVAAAARASPLLDEADMQELRQSTREMLASVYYRGYRHVGVYVHHDEDIVLGVDPPSHEEFELEDASKAREHFAAAARRILDVIDLLLPTGATQAPLGDTSSYRPNTAFIMMAIDPESPELEDIRNGVKEVFEEFGIKAVAADELEHGDAITTRILEEIETSEFLMADLTRERPNVYYEVGHAHARGKRVILYRKKGTELHFDVAHRNCPEYENTTGLKQRLRKRLETITNKRGKRQASRRSSLS